LIKIILIVWPSGAGKDTLINSIKGKIDANFVKRHITRASDSSEQNYFVNHEEFKKLKYEGFFISTWSAHSHQYGIAKNEIKDGINIISVSRSVIQDFEKEFNKVATINITVPRDELYKRLKNRNREGEEMIQERLKRSYNHIEAKMLLDFDNQAPLQKSSSKFLNLVECLSVSYFDPQ
jgi:ribose 1,5-bisphosphokinase